MPPSRHRHHRLTAGPWSNLGRGIAFAAVEAVFEALQHLSAWRASPPGRPRISIKTALAPSSTPAGWAPLRRRCASAAPDAIEWSTREVATSIARSCPMDRCWRCWRAAARSADRVLTAPARPARSGLEELEASPWASASARNPGALDRCAAWVCHTALDLLDRWVPARMSP